MPTPRRRVVEPAAEVLAAFARARGQLGVPEGFPPEVAAAAWQAARRGPQDVPGAAPGRVDRTDLALVTIDPPGSRDLDQALHVARLGGGFVVHYAIADVAAFVEPGGPVDREAWARGVTRYSPDLRTPLHPPVLSEDAASLLPGQDRAAVLWRLALSRDGTLQDVSVRRALVRSRAQLTYAEAQQAIDAGSDPLLLALSEVGRLRAEREWARGGISLQLPEQELTAAGIAYRVPLPVERWNAQISLLTGMAAAELALSRGEGVLRSLPAAPEEVVGGLRRQARALGLPWPAEASYADFVRTLQPARPTDAAMLHQAARGLRGAGYTAWSPAPTRPTCATPHWPRRTPTPPRRCAGWPTATHWRSRSRSAPTARCPTGSTRPCPPSPTRCAPRPPRPPPSTAPSPRSPRRRPCGPTSARPSRAWPSPPAAVAAWSSSATRP